MEESYHAADNSNWTGILGSLINAGASLGGSLLAPSVNKNDAKQQTLETPGANPKVKASAFNWKPWAIGGGVFVVVVGLALLLFRKK